MKQVLERIVILNIMTPKGTENISFQKFSSFAAFFIFIRRVLDAKEIFDGASPKNCLTMHIQLSIISLPRLKMDMISLRYLFVVLRNKKCQMLTESPRRREEYSSKLI